jgi:hypothetical protein
MFLEDLKPNGGILSWRRDVQRYMGLMVEPGEGVEKIVLWKGGDVGRRAGSGEMVAG